MPTSLASAAKTYSAPISDIAALPKLVVLTRSRLLAACRTGDIEALRAPIDANEVRPLFERGVARGLGADPIATLKALSFDGGGRETMALLRAVLTQSCLRETRGLSTMFVWPAFAILPPSDPSPEERQVMLSCLRFADLKALGDTPPPFMRAGLGADGVWHYFWNAA